MSPLDAIRLKQGDSGFAYKIMNGGGNAEREASALLSSADADGDHRTNDVPSGDFHVARS